MMTYTFYFSDGSTYTCDHESREAAEEHAQAIANNNDLKLWDIEEVESRVFFF